MDQETQDMIVKNMTLVRNIILKTKQDVAQKYDCEIVIDVNNENINVYSDGTFEFKYIFPYR
jgi:hypothetical protein